MNRVSTYRRPLALVTLFIALVVSPLWSATARAEIESTVVKQGLAAFADLEYARAVALLQEAQQESLTREEKIVVYRTLALAHIALGDSTAAKNAFIGLLRVDPTFQIERGAAPKVRALFEAAKAQAATSGRIDDALPSVKPTIEPARPVEGEAVRVTVRYPGGVAKTMSLYHRTAAARAFEVRSVPAASDGTFTATVPASAIRAPVLQLHVTLLDGAGAGIAGAGSVALPIEIPIVARTRPVYKRGWFWGVVVGVAGAAAVAGTLGAVLPQQNARVEVRPL
jgi:hypothetical protein